MRSDSWVPVRLHVSNPGPETDVEIVVYAVDTAGSRMPLLVRAPLHLAAGVLRRHTMYLRPGNCDKLIFEMYDGNQRLTNRTSVTPMHMQPAAPLLLGLSRDGEGFVCTQESSDVGRLRFSNVLWFADLSERMQGHEAVDAIVLGSLPAEGMSVLQQRAIIEWVRAGGLLIFSPGAYTHNYEGSLLEGLLPVRILGSRLVAGLPPLEEIYGPIRREKERIGLAEVAVQDGEVELQMGQFPLIVSRREGAGRVVFVAFGLSSARLLVWPNLKDLYSDLVGGHGRLPAVSKSHLPAEAARILHESMGVEVMPRRMVAGFLGVNVALVIVVLLLMRRHREYGFLILVFAAPVFALAINVFGRTASDLETPLKAGLHVVRTSSGQSRGAGNGFHAVLSDKEARVNVVFPASAFCQVLPVLPAGGKRLTSAEAVQDSYEMADEDLKWVRGLRLRPRAVCILESSYLAAMPGAISARAVFDSEGIVVEVANESEASFERGFVACNRNAAVLPDLAPGESASVRLSRATAQGLMTGFSRKALKDKRESENDRLINALYAVDVAGEVADTGLQVFGWLEREPVTLKPVGLETEASGGGRTLWLVTPDRQCEGERLLLPKGVVSMRLHRPRNNVFRDGRWADIYSNAEVNIDFGLPHGLRKLKATGATLFLRVGRGPTLVALEALNWETGEYDVIVGERAGEAEHARPAATRRTAFVLQNPARYVAPGRGFVRVYLMVKSAAAVSPGAAAGSYALIEDLDMEIEGILE